MASNRKHAEPSGSPVYVGRLAGVIYRRFTDPSSASKDWHLYNSKRLPVTLERHQELKNGMTVIESVPNPDLSGPWSPALCPT